MWCFHWCMLTFYKFTRWLLIHSLCGNVLTCHRNRVFMCGCLHTYVGMSLHVTGISIICWNFNNFSAGTFPPLFHAFWGSLAIYLLPYGNVSLILAFYFCLACIMQYLRELCTLIAGFKCLQQLSLTQSYTWKQGW